MSIIDSIKLTFILMAICSAVGLFFYLRREHKIATAADKTESHIHSKAEKYIGMPTVRGDQMVLAMHPQDRTAMIALANGVTKELPFEAFTGIEIKENSSSVASSQREGVLGRAVIGGLVAGGTGAVIGALTATNVTRIHEIIRHISVHVYTSDPEFPHLSWTTFEPTFGVENMKEAEVNIQRQLAIDFYNQFAPIFS